MKIYGKIYRNAVPVTTETNEIYYIFENVPENNKTIKRRYRHYSRAIIFVGILVASGIWKLRHDIQEQRNELNRISKEIEKEKQKE